MASNPELYLMTQLLNLEGVKVIDYRLIEGIGIILSLENTNQQVICPNCGKTTELLHQNNFQTVRDLSFGGLKEELRNIFETNKNWSEGLLNLADWLKDISEYFPKSLGTIKRWIGEIIAYFDSGTTQGVVEGINNKLKLIKRRAFGFRNFDNFQLRSFLTWHFAS